MNKNFYCGFLLDLSVSLFSAWSFNDGVIQIDTVVNLLLPFYAIHFENICSLCMAIRMSICGCHESDAYSVGPCLSDHVCLAKHIR